VCAPRTLAHEILNECGDQRSLTLDLECELEFAQQTCLPLVLKILEVIMASDHAKGCFAARTGLSPTTQNVLAQLVEAISAPWLGYTQATVDALLVARDGDCPPDQIREYLNSRTG
jgi:hypothetical protein